MPKVLTFQQLLERKYKYLENLPDKILRSFGQLTQSFTMIIWGDSGHGKSNLIMQLIQVLKKYGNVMVLGLEEGHESTMQMNAIRNLKQEEGDHKIYFTDHEMNYDELVIRLRKKKSPKFILIDSVQYWNITFNQYKALKEKFYGKKVFIFISHQKGKLPDGKLADQIRYDATIKGRVEGYVLFVKSRLGGNKNYIIWEEGAKKYWGKKFKKISNE